MLASAVRRNVVWLPHTGAAPQPDIPIDVAALTSCGVSTGWGAAVNSAEVRPGHVVIVEGTGGIGMNAVQGAAHAGKIFSESATS